MSKEIDWSKAPEGATHARNCGWDNPDWYKIVYGVLMVHSCNEGWDESGYSDMGEIPNLQTRPAKAWTGTGLPPVGTVCEVLWNESRMEYLRTKVFGVNEHGQPIHRFDEGPKKFEYQADPMVTVFGTKVFRPIRTQAQIEAEEREKSIDVIQDDLSLSPECRYIAKRVYDAGYRKTEAGK